MIESYSFGRIVIDGEVYTSDVIVFPGRIIDNWWRKEGHLLQNADLESVFDEMPEKLIIGMGNMGRMDVANEVFEKAAVNGIEVSTANTGEAAREYNNSKGRVACALHLTC